MGRDIQDTQGTKVVTWRKRALVAAGFDAPFAARLGTNRRFDLHALLELAGAGCPLFLAGPILAPLDPDWETTT